MLPVEERGIIPMGALAPLGTAGGGYPGRLPVDEPFATAVADAFFQGEQVVVLALFCSREAVDQGRATQDVIGPVDIRQGE